MNPERFFVLDTNVLVSAFLLRHSTPRQALDAALRLGVVVHSEETLNELWEVLVRPKFDRYVPLAERLTLLQGFEKMTRLVLVDHPVALCRDPRDDKFLSLALAATAEYITSGDQDLLVLAADFPVPIVTPGEFLARVGAG